MDRTFPARDLVIYEIELETDAGAKRFEFDEMNLSEELGALIEEFAKRSRPVRL